MVYKENVMGTRNPVRLLCSLFVFTLVVTQLALAADSPEKVEVTVRWGRVVRVSKTSATLQVVPSPCHRRGAALHDQLWRALRDLKCDDVRYCPWYVYPKLVVAELNPPLDGKTSWDFTLLDPLTLDFLEAMAGRPIIMNFSTIPQWMFKTPKPVPFPSDPNTMTLSYGVQGTELRDPSMQEVADYFARIVSWYTKGGFVDEYGKRHESGHHYKVDYWEVLNEMEHRMTPETYTRVYDAVVAAIRKVQPAMKFVALALGDPSNELKYFEYFLNPRNHQPGIAIDMISYHFYAGVDHNQTARWPFAFEQADHFLDAVGHIESIRQRLSPKTGTTVDEIGALFPGDTTPGSGETIRKSFWNLSAALYAYVYAQLARQGINAAGESTLWAHASEWPDCSLLDWKNGQPNARYRVLKLIRDNFGPGDKLVDTRRLPDVFAQGFATRDGKHKILLVNKRDRTFEVTLAGTRGGHLEVVDEKTGLQPPASTELSSGEVTLRGFAVAVVTLPL